MKVIKALETENGCRIKVKLAVEELNSKIDFYLTRLEEQVELKEHIKAKLLECLDVIRPSYDLSDASKGFKGVEYYGAEDLENLEVFFKKFCPLFIKICKILGEIYFPVHIKSTRKYNQVNGIYLEARVSNYTQGSNLLDYLEQFYRGEVEESKNIDLSDFGDHVLIDLIFMHSIKVEWKTTVACLEDIEVARKLNELFLSA
ncbi:MAG: hypothetical protein QXL78_02395 [Methanocellales archaeon]